MPSKKNTKNLINLLPQEEFAGSTFGRVLAWLMTTFRTIVIISEMIVMAAFLSRFWLDAKNADLTDAIQQRQAVVASYADFEASFRSAQKKITIYSQVANPKPDSHKIIETAGSILPIGSKLTSITFSTKEVEIKGSSPSEKDIASYTQSLKATDLFSEVMVTQLNLDETGSLVIFNIKLNLKES